jgi:cytochrome c oxidase subunit 2
MEETLDPEVTLKVIGHQWYWGYEYADFLKFENGDILEFDSYLIPEADMKVMTGSVVGFRLLDVDTRVVLPIRTFIRLLVTSEDVLHSWAVPSFGIKLDACPGRLNQVIFYIKREGVFFGQCSEICGVLHGFMPIAVRAVTWGDFTNWIVSKFPLIDLTKRIH